MNDCGWDGQLQINGDDMEYFRFKGGSMQTEAYALLAGEPDDQHTRDVKERGRFGGIVCGRTEYTEAAVGAESVASQTRAFTFMQKLPYDYKIGEVFALAMLMGICSLAFYRQMKHPLSYKEIRFEEEEL